MSRVLKCQICEAGRGPEFEAEALSHSYARGLAAPSLARAPKMQGESGDIALNVSLTGTVMARAS